MLPTVDEMDSENSDTDLEYPLVITHQFIAGGGGCPVSNGGCPVGNGECSVEGLATGGGAGCTLVIDGDSACPVAVGGGAIGGGGGVATVSQQSEEVVPSERPLLPHGAKDLIREQMRKASVAADLSLMHMPRPSLPALNMSRIQSRRGSMVPGELSNWPITLHLFQLCFPFHIIFDKDLVIRYMGISLTRLLPKAVVNGAVLTDYFDLDRPRIALSYKNIRTSLHNNFIIFTKPSVLFSNSPPIKSPLYFRGQMILTSRYEGAHVLFLCSPRVSGVEELEHQGLYLSDIPVHDVTRDLLLLNRHFRVEMSIAAELEETKKDLEIQKARVEHEKHRADQLLHSMLPPSIAHELKIKGEATAIECGSVTILFSDIKNFTNICNSCEPMQVVGMLNTLYTLFDIQSENHKVYKVS